MSDSLKRFIPAIAAGVFMFICLFFYMNVYNDAEAEILKQEQHVRDLQNEIAVKKASNEKAQEKNVQDATGLDSKRVRKDDARAEKVMQGVMTWHSYDEYNAVRTKLKKNYGLTDDSRFLSVFMPVVPEAEAPDGSKYNIIDTGGMNVTYEGMETYVVNIRGDVYSYFAFVTWSSADEHGNESEHTDIVTYSMDLDGTVTNLDAYVISD